MFPSPNSGSLSVEKIQNRLHSSAVLVKVYHGSPEKRPLLREGAFVSTMLQRSAKYARYPNNGEGTHVGYIFELFVDDGDVSWDNRDDCIQGRLKKEVLANRWTLSEQSLDLTARQSPVKIKADGTCVWSDGEPIEWQTLKLVEPQTVPTDILVSVAGDQMASGKLDQVILRELQTRIGYEHCPAKDRAAIGEFNATVYMPRFGHTMMPPGIIKVPGAKPSPTPAYYQKQGHRILTNMDTASFDEAARVHDDKPNQPSVYDTATAKFGAPVGTAKSSKLVFISHSSKDADLAEAIVDLLCTALSLKRSDFLCTSVEGSKLRGGDDTDDVLRDNIRTVPAFLSLLTRESVASTYVLFELGARWGHGLHHIPLLAKGAGTDVLREPLKAKNALRLSREPDVLQLVTDLAHVLNLTAEPPNSYLAKAKHVAEISNKVPALIGAKTGSRTQPAGKVNKWRLRKEARSQLEIGEIRILKTLAEPGEKGARLSIDFLAESLNFPVERIKRLVHSLMERRYITAVLVDGRPVQYEITQTGWAFFLG